MTYEEFESLPSSAQNMLRSEAESDYFCDQASGGGNYGWETWIASKPLLTEEEIYQAEIAFDRSYFGTL